MVRSRTAFEISVDDSNSSAPATEAAERIARVKAPVLVVHGSEDRLIPPALGQALYERAPHPKRFVLVEGGSHHSTNAVGQPLYRQALADLFGLRAAE